MPGLGRLSKLDPAALDEPAQLIYNPEAGRKLGASINSASVEAAQLALAAVGVRFDPLPTERIGHASVLASGAVARGSRLVIAAGGDGTIGEVAQVLAGTDTVLGVMPLGTFMNVARMLSIPRDVEAAAKIIRAGDVLAMDLGETGGGYFLEAAGVGLDAGLFAYFGQLDHKGLRYGVVKAALRYLKEFRARRLLIEVDGDWRQVRAPLVAVANGPFVGAGYAIAPDARIDDGLLDVVIFQGASVARTVLHYLVAAWGGQLPLPADAERVQARSVEVRTRRRRPLPVHADGRTFGITPATFRIVPAALKVVVGQPGCSARCAWAVPTS